MRCWVSNICARLLSGQPEKRNTFSGRTLNTISNDCSMLSMNNIKAEHTRSTKRTSFDFTSQSPKHRLTKLRFVGAYASICGGLRMDFFSYFSFELRHHLPARFTAFAQYGNRTPNSLETRRIPFFFFFGMISSDPAMRPATLLRFCPSAVCAAFL